MGIISFMENNNIKHVDLTEKQIAEKVKQNLQKKNNSAQIVCEYCGATLTEKELKCSHCGASIKR